MWCGATTVIRLPCTYQSTNYISTLENDEQNCKEKLMKHFKDVDLVYGNQ